MEVKFCPKDSSIRFLGRWDVSETVATTTSPGSCVDVAFYGKTVTLHFDTSGMSHPYPHLWICIDNGWEIEVPIDKHLRIAAPNEDTHVVRVVMKSAASYGQRWYPPLDACVRFLGYDSERNAELPEAKNTIAFVGDSITEGVFVDEDSIPGWDLCGNLVYQNDAMATYAWLASMELGYDPIVLGYGSSGVTRGGLGCVPKASQAYGFCYDQKPINYPDPKYVVVNHGVNDQDADPDEFYRGYLDLLSVISQLHPSSTIILLQPFSGLWEKELRQIATTFSNTIGGSVWYISTNGWYSAGPLHPYRSGHKAISEKLVAAIREKERECERQ